MENHRKGVRDRRVAKLIAGHLSRAAVKPIRLLVAILLCVAASVAGPATAAVFIIPADMSEVTPDTFSGFQYGDTFEFASGPRGSIRFRDFAGAGQPTTLIRNASDGITVIDAADSEMLGLNVRFGVNLVNCKNVRVSGSAFEGAEYGLVVMHSESSDDFTGGVWAQAGVSEIEIDHVEVVGGQTIHAGIIVKNEPDPSKGITRETFVHRDTHVHECSVYDVLTEGLYVGSSGWELGSSIELRGVRIFGNRTVNTGWDGIQVGSAVEDVAVFGNSVERPGQTLTSGQFNGLVVNNGSVGAYHGNVIVDAPVHGIMVNGHRPDGAFVACYNNLIVNDIPKVYVVEEGRMGAGVTWRDRQETGAIYNNTIIRPYGPGIYYPNAATHVADLAIYNNVIAADPGEAWQEMILIPAGLESVVATHNDALGIAGGRFADAVGGDYRLTSGSPGVNTGVVGDPAFPYPESDFDGVPRPQAGAPDRGAFEFIAADIASLIDPPAALEAIHPDQPLLMIAVDEATVDLADIWVFSAAAGVDRHVHLVDDGGGEASGDWSANDGIWTADLSDVLPNLDPGEWTLPIFARDSGGAMFTGDLGLSVLGAAPAVYYRNGSRESGLDYAGQPSGVAAIDLAALGGGPADASRDACISRFDQDGMVVAWSGLDGDVPVYDNVSGERFLTSDRPAPNHAPAISVDLDNDGLQDLIVPAGNSGEGVLIYRQDPGTGTFMLTNWLDLDANLQEHTWAAACADYDGDGLVDIYLCRAASSGNQLPRGGTAAADVLLRNDLVNSGRFIDVSEEIEIPLDQNQNPLPLVSRTAAWCDYDHDGDPDLAVADCAGLGFYVYENDPVAGLPRFRVSYPDDPGSTNAFNTSDLAWVDHDGDGDADLIVTTFWGSGTPGEPYVYENNHLMTGAPFSQVPVLGVAPPHATSGVRVLDANLDGCQDLMLLPDQQIGSPALVLNNGAGNFSLAAEGVGLSALTGVANGGLVADLNGDGGAELFLGQLQTNRRFLATARGADSFSDDWIGLELVVERESGRFSPAYGARVQVTTAPDGPHNTVTMTVGANGTEDRVLRIGFADGFTPTCEIHWPNAHLTQPDLSNDLHTVKRLEQPGTFEISTGSVTGRPEMQPLSYLDFVFHWTTNYQTDPGLDFVEFDMTGPFTPPRAELHAGDPDVVARQWVEGSGQDRVFHHEIRLINQPCVNEYYAYWVHSGTATHTDSDGGGLFRVKFCTSDDPDDPQDPPGGE